MNSSNTNQNSRSSEKGVKQSKVRKTPANPKKKQNIKHAVSAVKENDKEDKYRSGSLGRQIPSKVQESPRKAQSVDRHQSTRKTVKEPESINHAKKRSTKLINSVDNDKGKGKSESTSIKHESRRNNVTNQKRNAKSESMNADNSSRTKKSSKPKTNLQIAKSFVQSSQVKSQKLSKSLDAATASKQDAKLAYTTENDSILERPRTSTIQKGPTVSVNSQPELEIAMKGTTSLKIQRQLSRSKNSLSEASDSERASYEEDFEDYDSDFEESDSESISETSYSDEDENISDPEVNKTVPKSEIIKASNTSPEIKQPIVLSKKPSEKTFLKLSDRSSLFMEKNNSSDEKKPIKLSRSYINFDSAVAADENVRNAKELNESSQEVESKGIYHDVRDVMENLQENYRYIAKSTLKQTCIQTENCEEEEMQTDEIEMLNKWTQNPTNGTMGYGGDKTSFIEDNTDAWKALFNEHSTKLSTFLQRSSNIILTLLEEEFTSFQMKSNKKRSDFIYSDGYYIISPLNVLTGIPIVNMCCCSDSSPYIITIHGDMIQLPSSNEFVDDKGVICVWNILESSQPEYILTTNSQPTCGTFGPGASDIVIGGMIDGAVMLWDLSDLNASNLQVESGSPISLRSPTYNTAVVMGHENHNSCIVGIQSVYKSAKSDWRLSGMEKTDSLKSFHVLTLEDMGVINIWVVVEVLKPDLSGLESDLGLAPGGKFRLVKSACLPLHSLITLQLEQKNSIRTFDFRLVPYDSSRMLVTTDAGIILHVTRHSGVIEPRYYSSESDFNAEVRCMDCSPHNEDLFLVGCSDGSIKLYSVKLVRPLLEFLQASKGEPVNLLQWSVVDPCVFCVLSSSSCIHLWNLMEDSIHPIYSYNFEDCKITWFLFKKGKENKNESTSSMSSSFIIAKESGEIEVHNFRQNIAKQDYRIQYEYMQNL